MTTGIIDNFSVMTDSFETVKCPNKYFQTKAVYNQVVKPAGRVSSCQRAAASAGSIVKENSSGKSRWKRTHGVKRADF
jgi:hypothetical protein